VVVPLRGAVHAICVLFSGEPAPDLKRVLQPGLPNLMRLLHSNDDVVLFHMCEALASYSEPPNTVPSLINADYYEHLVSIVTTNTDEDVQTEAMRALGKLVTSSPLMTTIIDGGALPKLISFCVPTFAIDRLIILL
jgi:importin subunit alpha-1